MERLVDSMRKKVLLGLTLALVAFMAIPGAAAFAHEKVPVSCSLVLFVLDPGTDEVKVKGDKIKVKNSGQVAGGWLDCGNPIGNPLNPIFDEDGNLVSANPDHPLDGLVSTLHGSKVKVDPGTDTFEGKLKGDITLFSLLSGTLTGKIKAKVSGSGLLAAFEGDPSELAESIEGKVKLKGEEIKVKATFGIDLAFDGTTLSGGGPLLGEMKLDD
ncbi:MAG: hypothetical protein V3U79_07170 [Dehalococcoidia bacterium]